VGIDLGTTNSCISVLDGKTPRILENDEGARITPSIVAFTRDGKVHVGRHAATHDNPIFAIKHLIGRQYDDPAIQHIIKKAPDRIVKADNGDAWVENQGSKYSPSMISSCILKNMKRAAQR